MGRSVPAVARALDILELFLEHETLSAPEITALLQLPRTTVHELVSTLADRAYLLETAEEAKRFELGPSTSTLGQRYLSRVDLSRHGKQIAESMVAQCNETVHVAIRDEDSVIYVAKVDSSHSVRMVSAIGKRLPAHCTGVGKALLSGLSDAEFDALYPPGTTLPKMTGRSIDTPEKLKERIQQVRETGFATEYCESNEDVACVAAPVYDVSGHVTAGLSISVPITRWNTSVEAKLAEIVTKGAAELSHRLGGPTPLEARGLVDQAARGGRSD